MNFRKMKTVRPVFFLCFIFLAKNIFASPFDMILTGDPVLEDLRFLSLESGRPFLSFTPPLSPAEIEHFLDDIDSSRFSGPAQEAYLRIRERLTPRARLSFTSDIFSAFLDIHSTVEARARFNEDIDWHPRHPHIAPMFSFPARFFFADIFQLYFEPFVAVIVPHYESAGRFGTNMHYDVDGELDPTFPHRVFAAAGGPWWNFQIGRDRLFWGTGHTGSLSFSQGSRYFEYARLSFFSGQIKYSLLISQMPLRIDAMHGSAYEPSYEYFFRTTQRYFYLHRLDFMLGNTLSVGIMEGRMTGNSPLNFRYIVPSVLSTANRESLSSSFFSLEANWNIFRSFSVYGQFVMNDFAADSSPNGLGFMAGLNLARSFNSWGAVFFLEYIHTQPYLYMTSSPFSSFIHMNRTTAAGTGVQYHFIGFPRDTSALTLGARFFRGSVFSFEGELSWLSRGENAARDVVWSWSGSSAASSGVPEHNFIAALSAQWRPLLHIAFGGNITGILSHNNENNSGSHKAGGQVSFSVTFHY